MNPRALIAAALSAALATAGCGSGGGQSSTATPRSGTSGAVMSGKQLFTSVGCSTCHTLADAGSNGQVGPNLDNLKPSVTAVTKQVTHGGGGMPAFDDQLSPIQITSVAKYVASVAGH